MKKIILFLLLTFGIKTAFADCAMSAMYFFPETKEISLNSKFIIQNCPTTYGVFCNKSIWLSIIFI